MNALDLASLTADCIRIIPHEAVPLCGSYEVRFPDRRPSQFFYWDDIPGRRLRPDLVDGASAKQAAQSFARCEQSELDAALHCNKQVDHEAGKDHHPSR